MPTDDKGCSAGKIRCIDYAILGLIGLLTLFYSIYVYEFAEIHIQLPFLNFPIFIGEIFLAVCLALLFAKFIIKKEPARFQILSYFAIAFLVFVLIKAFHGYFKHGPLALRNAAIFYYLLFAIIGYHSYRREFFANKIIKYALLFLLSVIVFFIIGFKTFYFNYFILAVILFLGIKNKILRCLSIILFTFLCFKGIRIMFIAGRDTLISSLLAWLFIFGFFLYYFMTSQFKYRKQVILLIVLLFCIVPVYVWNTVDKAHIISLLNINKVFAEFRQNLKIVDAQKSSYIYADPPVRVYESVPSHISHLGRLKKQYLETEEKADVGKIDPQPVSDQVAINEEMTGAALKDKSKKELIRIIAENRPASTPIAQTQPIAAEVQVITESVKEPPPAPVVEPQAFSEVTQGQVSLMETKEPTNEEQTQTQPIAAEGQVITESVKEPPPSPAVESQPQPEVAQSQQPDFRVAAIEDALYTIDKLQDQSLVAESQVIAESVKEPVVPIPVVEPQVQSEETQGDVNLQNKSKEELIAIVLENKSNPVIKTVISKFTNNSAEDYNDSLKSKESSMIFRLLIWKDMLDDLLESKNIFGLDFGKPIRSKGIEILNFDTGWKFRVGWLEPHNAAIHIIYRAGIPGMAFMVVILGLFLKMATFFFTDRDIKGALLASMLLYWLIMSNLSVIFELPYFAIPFWCLFGMVYRYYLQRRLLKGMPEND